jgi:flavin-binding protein dodecin
MSDHVCKMELVGSSKAGTNDAVRRAIEAAAMTRQTRAPA